MTDPGTLHAWLDRVDTANGLDWYQHLFSREFECGCQAFTTYCPDWQKVITPPTPAPVTPRAEAHSAWIHTNSTPMPDELLRLEIPRRRYVVLNAWEHGSIRRIKELNPDCLVFVYKCLSSTRSNDANPNWALLPAGVSYQYAYATRPEWFLLKSGQRVQWSYSGHWQMDIGNPAYQAMWAQNVAKVKGLGFDGVWIDNLLWKRSAYSIQPDKYTTDFQLREAYRAAIRAVTPVLKAAGLLTIGNLNGAREVANGWASYLDAGLDGGFDEFWLSVKDDGSDILPEYEQGWKRVVDEIAYTESKVKIVIVQPRFPAGARKPFLYALASYFMAYPNGAGKAAIVEANGRDQYSNPTAWHPEYDWNLGTPLAPYVSVAANVFCRRFTNGIVVVNANKTGSPAVSFPLGSMYLNEAGAQVNAVALTGTSGSILRKV